MNLNSRACYPNRRASWNGPLLRGRRRAPPRRAAIMLELIVALPILVLITIAIVQFGFYFQNLQQLTIASRNGARVAAKTPGLPPTGGILPPSVLIAISQQLESADIEGCAFILEHNVLNGNDSDEQTFRAENPTCPDAADCVEPMSGIPPRSVRVTVCAKTDELMPNCLAMFGFDFSDSMSQSSTTIAYQLPVNGDTGP